MPKLIITGGPTNEPIDEVMKITNMSTGRLATTLSNKFLNANYEVIAILNTSVNIEKLKENKKAKNLKIVLVETTEDMLKALEKESKLKKTDIIIHASAVGDYKADYTFLFEDFAAHLAKKIEKGEVKTKEDIMSAFLEKEKYKIDNSSKISSYQKNLTVKLNLTPKIISNLRSWFPETLLIGCKLLDNVSKEELYDVATKLCRKNDLDFVLANDLNDLKQGDSTRYLVAQNGFTGEFLKTPEEIFERFY